MHVMNKHMRSALEACLSRRQFLTPPSPFTSHHRIHSVGASGGRFATVFPLDISSIHQSTSMRLYHSSMVTCMAVRRRRGSPTNSKKTNSTEDDSDPSRNSPLKHMAIDDDVEFVQAATALLDRLEVALDPMKAVNDFFEVERFFGEMGEILTIDLGPKDGKYRVEMSLEDHVFEYTSPISGKILYVLSATTGEWVGIDDGHSFEGLLVRDLIRQCRGLPKL